MHINDTQQSQAVTFYGFPLCFLLRFFSWGSGAVVCAITASHDQRLPWLGLIICIAGLVAMLQRHAAGEVTLEHDALLVPGSLLYRAQRISLLEIEAHHAGGWRKYFDVGTIRDTNDQLIARISEIESFKRQLHARRCLLLEQAAYEYARCLLTSELSADQPIFARCDQASHALGCMCAVQQRVAIERACPERDA